jgi:uncharacterized membrane protein YGL010W
MYAKAGWVILAQVVVWCLLTDLIGTAGKCIIVGLVYGGLCGLYGHFARHTPGRDLGVVTYAFVATFFCLCYFVGRLRDLA